ncbi:hypothetical protein IP88_08605 [alpha proteobacterium AAP81b]|nr:hypothetical protein IP88_08605 [alpha proteobacterium AAP81b]
MLHFLDVFIGFTFVMLVLSLAATALVETLANGIRNLKGVALRNSLADLLSRLLGLERQAALTVVDEMLRDRLLSDGTGKLATVMQREEFFRLLLDKAGSNADLKAKLIEAGIADPAAMLAAVRLRILDYERSNPELSNAMRASLAMLDEATGPFLAKLNGWYDQTIDRVDAIFTAKIRVWTLVVSTLMVLFLNFDAIDLINRLARDPALTARLSTQAEQQLPAYRAKVKALAQAQIAADVRKAAAASAASAAGGTEALATGDGAAKPGATNDAAGASASAPVGTATTPTPTPTPTPTIVTDGDDMLTQCAKAEARKFAAANAPAVKALAVRLPHAAPGAIADATGRLAAKLVPATSAFYTCSGVVADASDVVTLPASADAWLAGWRQAWGSDASSLPDHIGGVMLHLAGLTLSVALLSLGAPFWYETLSRFIKLRSVLSGKDDEARKERQLTSNAVGKVPPPPTLAVKAPAPTPPAPAMVPPAESAGNTAPPDP